MKTMPMLARILTNSAPVAVAAGALLAGCGNPGPSSREAPPPAPLAVSVATFRPGQAGSDLVFPARIKAAQEVTLDSRIAARLTSLVAREGSRLRRGDPIAIFDAPESRRALTAARAEQASAELALTVATRQQARADSLFTRGVLAERDREVAGSDQRAAEARLEAARAALDALNSAVIVRAPFDGVVVRVHADPGADLPAGAPLVDLRSSAGLEVIAEVPESAVPRLASSPLSVQVGDGPWRRARLARLEGMTDWRTRSRTAHVLFEGDADPGAYARLALGAPPDSSGDGSVPAASLVARGALSGVYVIESGQARLRWLKLGETRGSRVEVLSGLEPGECFALAPESLVDGSKVSVRP